jgi:DNA-binding MarR family transcriptional regulator
MSVDLRHLNDLDRLTHEPARLMVVTILSIGECTDFLFLQCETGLTKGNLSAHLSRFEVAGYVKIEKSFKGKLPMTICKLTPAGQRALKSYRQELQSFITTTE